MLLCATCTQKSCEQKFLYKGEIHLELPSPGCTVPALSAFPHRSGMSKAFHHLPGPLVDSGQHIHVSLFSEHWAQHFSCVGAEERGGITCLDLLVMLCQLQLQRLLAFFAIRACYWLMASLSPRSFSSHPACTGAWVIPAQEQSYVSFCRAS